MVWVHLLASLEYPVQISLGNFAGKQRSFDVVIICCLISIWLLSLPIVTVFFLVAFGGGGGSGGGGVVVSDGGDSDRSFGPCRTSDIHIRVRRRHVPSSRNLITSLYSD